MGKNMFNMMKIIGVSEERTHEMMDIVLSAYHDTDCPSDMVKDLVVGHVKEDVLLGIMIERFVRWNAEMIKRENEL